MAFDNLKEQTADDPDDADASEAEQERLRARVRRKLIARRALDSALDGKGGKKLTRAKIKAFAELCGGDLDDATRDEAGFDTAALRAPARRRKRRNTRGDEPKIKYTLASDLPPRKSMPAAETETRPNPPDPVSPAMPRDPVSDPLDPLYLPFEDEVPPPYDDPLLRVNPYLGVKDEDIPKFARYYGLEYDPDDPRGTRQKAARHAKIAATAHTDQVSAAGPPSEPSPSDPVPPARDAADDAGPVEAGPHPVLPGNGSLEGLARMAGVEALAGEAERAVAPGNTLEALLAHELVAGHAFAMNVICQSNNQFLAIESHCHGLTERVRLNQMTAASGLVGVRMMEAVQRGILLLDRLRNGVRYTYAVEHISRAPGESREDAETGK